MRKRVGPSRVGYIVNAYPVVSETFLVNELRGVERAGVSTAIIALSRRQDTVEPAGTDEIEGRILRPPELLPLGWLRFLRAHLEAFVGAPGDYLRILRDDLLRPFGMALRQPRKRNLWKGLRRRSRLFAMASLVARQAKRAEVGHLHAHYAKEPLEVAARVRWLTGLTYSFAVHAKDLYTSPPSRLARRLSKARFALACHDHGAATLRALAGPEDRGKVVQAPHGFDRDLFHVEPGDREPGLVVAAGRLTPKKGFDVLVEACSRLDPETGFRCVILGGGRLEARLRKAIRKRGLSGAVEIRGFVEQRELAQWYRRASAVVLPSRVLESGNRDGIPNVVVEAMACGAPVIATPVGGIPEIIDHGTSGLLVAPDDSQALAAALGRVLTDSSMARKLGATAAREVVHLDFEACCRPVAKRFRRLLARLGSQEREAIAVSDVDHRRLAARAARRLGKKPTLEPTTEQAIARAVLPGIRANAWRADVERLAERRLWDELAKAKRARELFRFAKARGVSIDSQARVLDLGCGRGGLSVALEASGVKVVPLDLRQRNCWVTRLRGERYGFELPAVSGRAEGLPFADDSFDAVCLLEVLEHVTDPAALLAEARRVCRPEGLCVVTVVNRWAHLDPHYRLWGVNFMPRRWAQALIELQGRDKLSWRDNQRLDDMHYFSFGAFRRFAGALGFEVHDPWTPEGHVASFLHRLGRRLSIGYNTVTLVLQPR